MKIIAISYCLRHDDGRLTHGTMYTEPDGAELLIKHLTTGHKSLKRSNVRVVEVESASVAGLMMQANFEGYDQGRKDERAFILADLRKQGVRI